MGSNLYSGLIQTVKDSGDINKFRTEQKQRELNLAVGQNAFQNQLDEQNQANALKQFAAPLGGVAGPGAPAEMGGAPVEAPLPDPDKVAFEFYTKINPDPAKASLVLDNVAKRAKEILDRTGDPEQMLTYTNGITGRTDKFAGFKGQMIQIKNDDGTTQLIEYEPQGGKLTDKGTYGPKKLITVGEKSRLYDPTSGKVLVNGVADNNMVPVKAEHNVRGPNGKPHTKLWYKDGSTDLLETVPSPGATIMAGAMQQHRTFKDERDLAKEFLSLPEVKQFPIVQEQLGKIQIAFDLSKKTNNKSAVDQALITTFNKMLDPTSVVRESEYARTAMDLPFFNRIAGGYEKFVAGGAGLTDDDRAALADLVQKMGSYVKERYLGQEEQYRGLADYYFPGTGASNRITRLGMKPGASTNTSTAPKAEAKSSGLGTTYTDPSDGSTWVQVGADPKKKESWRRK